MAAVTAASLESAKRASARQAGARATTADSGVSAGAAPRSEATSAYNAADAEMNAVAWLEQHFGMVSRRGCDCQWL